MGAFNTIFGGNNIAPALPTYLALSITSDTLLGWPTELTAAGKPVLAEILDITATLPGLTLQLDDARNSSTGYCVLIHNVGANPFEIQDNLGNSLLVIASGQVFQIYLADNTTQGGTWRVFQFGAGVSVANASSLAGAGLKAISTTLNENILIAQKSANYSIGGGFNQDRASCIEWTGGSGGIFSLPDPTVVGSGWFCYIQNSGTGTVTVTPTSGTINGNTSQVFQPFDSAIVTTDGTNFFTIGFGRAIASSFNFVQISLAGATGTVILSGAQLNRISYRFTGALAGNTTVQVPGSIQQYWVDNETTGAFTLSFNSAGGGASVIVPQGSKAILYCDGTNIINAVTIPTVAAGGSNTQVQYNNAGAFGGSTMTFQSGTGQFAIPASSGGSTLNVGGLFTNGLFESNVAVDTGWNAGPGTSGAGGVISAYLYNDRPTIFEFVLTSMSFSGGAVLGGPPGEQSYLGPTTPIPLILITGGTARIWMDGGGAFIRGWGPTAAAPIDMTPDASSWVATLSGPWAAGSNPTGTIKWSKQGSQITIYCDASINQVATGPSVLSISGVPPEIRPPVDRTVRCANLVDNGVGSVMGSASILAAGSITVSLDQVSGSKIVAGNYSGAGVSGIQSGWSVTYSL